MYAPETYSPPDRKFDSRRRHGVNLINPSCISKHTQGKEGTNPIKQRDNRRGESVAGEHSLAAGDVDLWDAGDTDTRGE